MGPPLHLVGHQATSPAVGSAPWAPARDPRAAHLSLPSASVGRGDGNIAAEKSSSSAARRANHAESFSRRVKSACLFSASLAGGLFTKLRGDLPLCSKVFKICPKDPERDFFGQFAISSNEKSRWVLL